MSPALLPFVPLAIAAALWLACGVFLGVLPPLCPVWTAAAAACTAVCAAAGPGAWTAGLAVNLPLAAACWYFSRGPGLHAGRVAVRAAARRGAA